MSDTEATSRPSSGAPSRSVRHNIVWSTLGQGVYNVCLWGMMVVLARLDRRGQLVGQFAIAYAVCLPVQLFFNLQLRAVLATDARRRFEFSDYFTLRLLSLPLSFTVVVVVVMFGPYSSGPTAKVILSVAVVKAVDALSDCFQALFQQHERMDMTAISMMVRGLVGVAALSLGTIMTGSVTVGATTLAAVLTLALLLVDWPMARGLLRQRHLLQSPAPWSTRRALLLEFSDLGRLRPLIWTALPLGMWALVAALVQFIPQYTLERLCGIEPLGIFMTFFSVVVALSSVVAAIGEAVVPRLARRIAEEDRAGFLALNLKFIGLIALICSVFVAGVALFGRHFLALVYGPTYAVEARTFLGLSVAAAAALVAGALSSSVMAAWRFRALSLATVVVAASSALLHLVFVSRYGLFGTVPALGGISVVTGVIYGALFISIVRGIPARPHERGLSPKTTS